MKHRVFCRRCGALHPEFTVTSKHLRDWLNDTHSYKYNSHTKHVTVHLCADCFAKLFPEEIDVH